MLKNRHGDVRDSFQDRGDGGDVLLLAGEHVKQLQNSEERERERSAWSGVEDLCWPSKHTVSFHLLDEIQSRGLWVGAEQLTNQLTELRYKRSKVAAEGLLGFLKNSARGLRRSRTSKNPGRLSTVFCACY